MTGRITKQKRSTRTNSRSGCVSCKKKRLKCDETTPACLNCLKRDIECPGYRQIFKWPSKCQTNTQDFSVKTQKRTRPKRSQDGSDGEGQSRPNVDGRYQSPVFGSTVPQNARQGDEDITHNFSHAGPDLSAFLEDWTDQNILENQDNTATILLNQDELDMPILDWNLTANEEPYTQSLPHLDPKDFDTISLNSPRTSVDEFSMPQSLDWLTFGQIMPEQARSNRRGGIKNLLKSFYGVNSSIPLPLVHQETKLVEYYFSNISGIYSCFDSHLNPFRSFVGQMWTLSPSMYYTIQSMAAAHLANGMHSMRKLGIDLHLKASQHLSQELSTCYAQDPRNEQILLVLLLIGLTASWHRPGDLGLPYLRIARSLMHLHPSFNPVSEFEGAGTLQQLFEEAMIYWEMMISFVANESDVDVIPLGQSPDNDNKQQQMPTRPEGGMSITAPSPLIDPFVAGMNETLPHPWTGISPQSQMLLAHVGRLVRRVRIAGRRGVPSSSSSSLKAAQARYLPLALELEESFLATLPTSTSTSTSTSTTTTTTSPPRPLIEVESGDQFTRTDDFFILAETTRDCGLLELYRTFPDLLRRRLGVTTTSSSSSSSSTTAAAAANNDNITEKETHAQRSWLTSLALHILTRLESIPDTSNIRCHQLLLLLIAGAELRFVSRQHGRREQPGYDICDGDVEITRARGFVKARLNVLAVRLPDQPVRVMLALLDEVWTRVDCCGDREDEGGDDVFWVDVMVEKGLHTVMG